MVDDGEDNRLILKQRLCASGYDDIQAVDGEDALAVAARERPY